MTVLNPIEEYSDFDSITDRIKGSKLVGVRYTAGDRDGDRGESPPVYSNERATELRADIELFFDARISLAIQWAMRGFDYGLSLKIEENVFCGDLDEDWYLPWKSVLGREVRGVRSAWLKPSNSSIYALWSVAFEFDSENSVAIALGRIEDDDSVDFSPDSLVVFWGSKYASAYKVPDSTGDAYGGYGEPEFSESS
ncbi:hypothetical protein [Segniliparus rugosus]|uniref:hypothetical protein n=1 Tax=Segniliparus rugosus TaxID=286804 RepID=UPI0012EB0FBC|nr:hypothetical protein [Segniliparus rugosus]